jgi:hypothetical protein
MAIAPIFQPRRSARHSQCNGESQLLSTQQPFKTPTQPVQYNSPDPRRPHYFANDPNPINNPLWQMSSQLSDLSIEDLGLDVGEELTLPVNNETSVVVAAATAAAPDGHSVAGSESSDNGFEDDNGHADGSRTLLTCGGPILYPQSLVFNRWRLSSTMARNI